MCQAARLIGRTVDVPDEDGLSQGDRLQTVFLDKSLVDEERSRTRVNHCRNAYTSMLGVG